MNRTMKIAVRQNYTMKKTRENKETGKPKELFVNTRLHKILSSKSGGNVLVICNHVTIWLFLQVLFTSATRMSIPRRLTFCFPGVWHQKTVKEADQSGSRKQLLLMRSSSTNLRLKNRTVTFNRTATFNRTKKICNSSKFYVSTVNKLVNWFFKVNCSLSCWTSTKDHRNIRPKLGKYLYLFQHWQQINCQ